MEAAMSGRKKPRKRPQVFWKTWKNVEKELHRWSGIHQCLPTSTLLDSTGFSSLRTGVVNYHGGVKAARDRAGLSREFGFRRKFGAYSKTGVSTAKMLHRLERDYLAIISSFGRPPSFGELEALGRVDLGRAIDRLYPGRFRGIRLKLGVSLGRPVGVPWSIQRIEAEYRAFGKRLGRPPTHADLRNEKRTLLDSIVRLYPDALTGLRRRMRERFVLRRVADPKTIEKEYKMIAKRLGRFPSWKELRGLDGALAHHITEKYPGGMRGLREALGIPQAYMPPNHWRKWENIESVLSAWLHEHGPPITSRRLKRIGFAYPSALTAIGKCHGGLVAVRKRMGYFPVTNSILESHAEHLARILVALGKSHADVMSDGLWSAIKGNWYTKNLENAVAAFESKGDVSAFRRLLKLK
jgi:hypothetical protein